MSKEVDDMPAPDSTMTLGVGAGEERILLRLTERALTAEVSPEYWSRLQGRLQERLDDGTLFGALIAVGSARAVRALKRWYLGPHDLAAVDMSFDGGCLRVQRHGLGDMFGRDRLARPNSWYASFDAVGGMWCEGFEAAEARAFIERFQVLREARLQVLGYGLGVATRVLAGAAAAGILAFAVARTIRPPKRPPET
ncbi:MAG: hypothetical protein HY321_03870 [Armatimonadetes bacterium]|nr:hypothetical protein [Armatimonadota bacterium]